MIKLALMMGAAVAVAGCQVKKADEAGAPAPLTQAAAEKIVADTEAAFGSGDANAIMAHYADGAVLFDQGIRAPVTDRQIQSRLVQGLVAMQPSDFTTADRHVQLLDQDTIVASGVMSFTAATGPARQMLTARYSDVYQRQPDGRWLIVHEHMSTPPPAAPAVGAQ